MKKTNTKNNAFTLIEMLAVMFIIGIIFSIALPTFGPIMTTLKLTTASENFANFMESARQYAMTSGQGCYVVFPTNTNDANMNYRTFKIHKFDANNPANRTSVGKWEFLPVGIRFDPNSTTLANAGTIDVPFPEDNNQAVFLPYVFCDVNGAIMPGNFIGNSTVTLIYDTNNSGSHDLGDFSQNIGLFSSPREVSVGSLIKK